MLEVERFRSESLEGMGNQLCRCGCAGQQQLIDRWGRGRGGCLGAPGGLGITGECSDRAASSHGSVGSVEVCPCRFAEQMGPARGAEVLHRDRVKTESHSVGSRGQKMHRDASNLRFLRLRAAWRRSILPNLSWQGLLQGGRPGRSLTHLPLVEVDAFSEVLLHLSCHLPWVFADGLISVFVKPTTLKSSQALP